ncbi:putative zinc-type alcohol dehydrogenase-like protein YycR [Metarhizium anisopliae]
MGIVEEVGSGVTLLTRGDRVVVPFNVADGRCCNCEEGKTAFCTGGAYGSSSVARRRTVELCSRGSLAVFGAGPVGLMAGHSAVLPGAARVFVVDRVPERLRAAEAMGCISVDFTECDAVEQIIKVSNGMVDRSIDAQAIDSRGSSEQPNVVLEYMIRLTRPCGGLGIPGLYVPR